jgi:class 3 adenylate cyclase
LILASRMDLLRSAPFALSGALTTPAIGTVANVASRLRDEANPSQILISLRVQMAVENAVKVEPVGEFAPSRRRRLTRDCEAGLIIPILRKP